jgi:hypothetical protein
MSRRKPLAALATVTAALAIAVPSASASAAPTAPAVRTAHIGVGSLGPGSLYCQIVYRDLRAAYASGNMLWANFFSNVFVYSGCGGAAI